MKNISELSDSKQIIFLYKNNSKRKRSAGIFDEENRVLQHPMDEHIEDLWSGTASKFINKLGMKGKIDYLLNKIGL